MPPEDARTHVTRQWLEKADHDLLTADRMSQATPVPDVVVFHCQQAAEKALKAFLTWHDQLFRRTHELADLVRQCAALDGEFDALLPAAKVLTPYAVDPRYPADDFSEPSAAEMDDARRLARQVVTFVLDRLPPQARP